MLKPDFCISLFTRHKSEIRRLGGLITQLWFEFSGQEEIGQIYRSKSLASICEWQK